MAFVQVNNVPQTLKIAAFIVAFFSSFFTYAADSLDLSALTSVSPKVTSSTVISCSTFGLVNVEGVNLPSSVILEACKPLYEASWNANAAYHKCNSNPTIAYEAVEGFLTGLVSYKLSSGTNTCYSGTVTARNPIQAQVTSVELLRTCPPDEHPAFTYPYDLDGNGKPDKCYDFNDIQAIVDAESEQKQKDEHCENLVLDSGNNSATDMCHTSISTGNSCNITKVTTDGGGTYYKGVSASDGGCFASENPPYDDEGAGDSDDGCFYSEGVNYCEANRSKHCEVTSGSTTCDSGCIDDGTSLYCDTAKHPDVGEGDSNYFDDKGTCSVIAASSSRGFCEDNDGTWDETTDYQETSCPSGAGTCSVATAGLCGSCFDAGGTWTPDPTALLSDEAKVGIENGALAKTGNDKLSQIEHGQRKTAEATQSTIKSGTGKIVSAIESLGEKLAGSKPAEEEKESFTTTTSTTDKSKINSLFDATATATLTADIETLKTDITTSINSIRAQASSMMSITVPSSTGYEARNLTLTQGTFDMSLNRFSDFFKALAMPVMLLCSILAGFILLGGKN